MVLFFIHHSNFNHQIKFHFFGICCSNFINFAHMSLKNEPSLSVVASHVFRKQLGMRPLVPFLANQIVSKPTGQRVHTLNDSSLFVFLNLFLHCSYNFRRNDAMLRPFLMTCAHFVFLPVFEFSTVSANACPCFCFNCAPVTDSMSSDKRTR